MLEEARDLQRRAAQLLRRTYRVRPSSGPLLNFVCWLDSGIFSGLTLLEEAEREGLEVDVIYLPNGYKEAHTAVLTLKPAGAQIIDMASARRRLRPEGGAR